MGECSCDHCEQLMQPYLDRVLTVDETEAESHLEGCSYCSARYTFESELRVVVKTACCEEMSPELKAKLVALRESDA